MDESMMGPATLRINVELYKQLAAERGWRSQAQQCVGLGLAQATVSRINSGLQSAGPRVVAAFLLAWPDQIKELLEVVPDRDAQGVA